MSCWTAGANNRGAGAQAVHAPQQIGAVVASPGKCPVCGWFTPRSGACINEDCGTRQTDLQAVGAWPQPASQAAAAWQRLAQIRHHPHSSTPDWEILNLTRDAYEYLRTTGIDPNKLVTLSLNTPPQIWMYLPRCPVCKAWVSPRRGVCNNPRCLKGRQKAQVVPARGWAWPPILNNLTHIQRALVDSYGVAPDAHVAWHARGHSLIHSTPSSSAPFQEGYAHLLELRQHVTEGHQAGWLDPESPAYDADAQQALEHAVGNMLEIMDDLDILALVAAEGRWELLALPRGPVLEAGLNFANPEAAAQSTREATSGYWEILTGPGQKYSRWDLADRVVDALEFAIERDLSPAFPPAYHPEISDFAGKIQMVLEGRHSWLIQRQMRPPVRSEAAQAYLRLSHSRVKNRGLTKVQRDDGLRSLYVAGADLGYPEMTREEQYATLDSGWTPAEARDAIRRKQRVDQRLRQAFSEGVTPKTAFEAGRILRHEGRSADGWTGRHTVTDKEPKRKSSWPGILDIEELYHLTTQERQAVIAGVGLGVVAFGNPDEVNDCLYPIFQIGDPDYLGHQSPPNHSWRDPQRIKERIRAEMQRQELCSSSASIDLLDTQHIRMIDGERNIQYNVCWENGQDGIRPRFIEVR